MSTNKKRGDYVRDADDIIEVSTDCVRIDLVEEILDRFERARNLITDTTEQAERWVNGLIAANGWTKGEAAHALGLTPNRVGQLVEGRLTGLTEQEMLTMLRRALLIDVDESPTSIEKSLSAVTPMRHKAG